MDKKDHIPLISIALATYNGERFLREQLDTLVGQTYPNLEIIVSDDGSSDHTWDILQEYAVAQQNIFIYRNEGEHGIKGNFWNALQQCKGELIALSDQDDIWMPQKIERQMAELGLNMLIYHNSLFVDEAGRSLDMTIKTNLHPYSGNDPRAFLLWNTVSGHAALFRRELLQAALPAPAIKHHDWWLAFIAAGNGGVKYLDEILIKYRQHAQSETDFLKLKNKKEDKAKMEAEATAWYEACATVPGKYRDFFREWLKRNKEKDQHIFNFRLFMLYYKARHAILFMRKKNSKSKFFYMLNKSWGDPARNSFRNKKRKLLTKK